MGQIRLFTLEARRERSRQAVMQAELQLLASQGGLGSLKDID